MAVVEDELSLVFSALADPTRRAILERLACGDATVNQLAEPFAMTQQAPTAPGAGREADGGGPPAPGGRGGPPASPGGPDPRSPGGAFWNRSASTRPPAGSRVPGRSGPPAMTASTSTWPPCTPSGA